MEERAMLDGMQVLEKLGLSKDEMFKIYSEILKKLDGIPYGAVLILIVSMINQIKDDITDEVLRHDFLKYIVENIQGDANE